MSPKTVERIKELTAMLNQWRYEYFTQNAPTVSDAVYDRHFDELKQLEDKTDIRLCNSPTQTVGYEVVEGLEKAAHPIPLLSLDKTKQIGELMNFIGSHQILIMHKLDGLTLKLEYENGSLIRASTRGNGELGEVVTHNARTIEGVPAQIPYKQRLVVVGEAYITKPTFERLRDTLRDNSGKPYKNARNMAAGSIRLYDAETCAGRGLVFSPFGVLEGLDEDKKTSESKFIKLMDLKYMGFTPCQFFLVTVNPSEKVIQDALSELKSLAEDKGLPIDGIVVTYNNIPFSMQCGRTSHHYKDGLAFKFEDDLHETILRDIEWNPSRFGELSPVALFDAVEIDGCDVSRASLHNLTFIKELELMPGCRILVSKRNLIIPHIEDNLDRGGFNGYSIVPGTCPCCGRLTRIQKTRKDKSRVIEVLRCDNNACATQNLRKFVHFASKKAMDIEGLSEATLEKFIGRGWFHSFTDIYRLDEHKREIVCMEGFGEKSWRRLWDSIQRSRKTTFERFVISMDIPMVGRTASRELNRYFNSDVNALKSAVDNGFDFTTLNDFGEVLNHNIHNWFKNNENLNLWKELQTMIEIEKPGETMAAETPDNPFAGRTIVVTGKLEQFTRDSINAKIESLGAKAGSAVSKSTDYLIAGAKAGSKLDKAQLLGVTVISEQEFLNMAESA